MIFFRPSDTKLKCMFELSLNFDARLIHLNSNYSKLSTQTINFNLFLDSLVQNRLHNLKV